MVKSLPTVQELQETWVGWGRPLEEGMARPSSDLAWRAPRAEEPGGYSPGSRKELDMTEQLGAARRPLP